MKDRVADAAGAPAEQAAGALAGKYLTFKLGGESYGLRILKVQEIIGLMNVTPVPKAPPCVRGVINLRGKVIPVIALRKAFEMAEVEDSEKTCIIVVQVWGGDERHEVTMGVLVGEVSEVLDVDAEQVEPTPDFGASLCTDFILGLGKIGDRVVMLLDVDRVVSQRDVLLSEPLESTTVQSA